MASFSALVARLARRVRRTTIRSVAVARDVAELAASVALHGLSLAVASEVVRATALVASRSTICLHASESAATATEASSATTNGRDCGSGRGSVRVRAVALGCVSVCLKGLDGRVLNVQPSGQPVRRSSSVRQQRRRSNATSDNQLERGQGPDSGSTAWLDPSLAAYPRSRKLLN